MSIEKLRPYLWAGTGLVVGAGLAALLTFSPYLFCSGSADSPDCGRRIGLLETVLLAGAPVAAAIGIALGRRLVPFLAGTACLCFALFLDLGALAGTYDPSYLLLSLLLASTILAWILLVANAQNPNAAWARRKRLRGVVAIACIVLSVYVMVFADVHALLPAMTAVGVLLTQASGFVGLPRVAPPPAPSAARA